MKRLCLVTGLFFCLAGCVSGWTTFERRKLPYNTWYIGLSAPRHMEVWVESVDVFDRSQKLYFNVFGGVAGYASTPGGWNRGAGKTMPISNVDLPVQVVLRWQSLVEPQTYRIRIDIPQWVRDEMIKPTHMYCAPAKRDMTLYPHTLTLGMAPGGIVKVWLGAGCLGYKEIGRYQAEVDPRGPYGGKSNGQYVPIEPGNKAYVEKHGIPYGTW